MSNGKITDKPVATKQSEAAGKKNAPSVRSGQAQRRQPGRQGPPQPRSWQRGMVAAPLAGQDSGYMLSAMAEYRRATAAQVESVLGAEAQKKAQRSEMIALAPKGAAKIAAGMAAGKTVAGLTGKASEKPSAARPASKAGPDKKSNDGAARRVMAMAEDITSRDGELDFGLGY